RCLTGSISQMQICIALILETHSSSVLNSTVLNLRTRAWTEQIAGMFLFFRLTFSGQLFKQQISVTRPLRTRYSGMQISLEPGSATRRVSSAWTTGRVCLGEVG